MPLIRDFVAHGRLQSAPVTIMIAIFGAMLAGEMPTGRGEFILIGLCAMFLHAFGFGFNNICDLEHDRKDPNKTHFPLVLTLINSTQAYAFVFLMLGLSSFSFSQLMPNSLSPVIFYSGSILLGIMYCICSKKVPYAFIFQTGSMVFLLFAFYSCYSTVVSFEIVAMAISLLAYSFIAAMYGSLKDIRVDPKNLARSLGTRVVVSIRHSRTFIFYTIKTHAFMAITLGTLSIANLSLILMNSDLMSSWQVPVYFILFWIIWGVCYHQFTDGEYDRKTLFRYGSALMMAAYVQIIVSLSTILGTTFFWWALVFPPTWYIVGNMWLYNEFIEPQA